MNYPSYLDAMAAHSGISTVLRSLLFDGITGLPTLPLVIESLRDVANDHRKLGFIFIHTDALEQLEIQYGWEAVDHLISEIPSFLNTIASDFSPLRVLSVQRLQGDNFLLVVYSNDPANPLSRAKLAEVSDHLQNKLGRFVSSKVSAERVPYIHVFSGHSFLEHNSDVRFERSIARSVNKAFLAAVRQYENAKQIQINELKNVLKTRQIKTIFQPVVSLTVPTDILGYEALSRGPEGTFFEKTGYMFSLAAANDLLTELETVCQESLLKSLATTNVPDHLFVNMEALVFEKDGYQTLPLFKNGSMNHRKIIVELTERTAISDATIGQTIHLIRQKGFRIAVDDVGSGYASLESVALIKPDFVKLSQKIVQGISRDYIKQEIVKTLRNVANGFSAILIAEGIETEEDLKTLQQLNIPYGQGHLLRAPSDVL